MDARVYSVLEIRVERLDPIWEFLPAIAISALGKIKIMGWSDADLRPLIIEEAPADGMLNLDFVVKLPQASDLFDTFVPLVKAMFVPAWVRGVRVYGSTNYEEAMLADSAQASDVDLLGEGMPLPWPFPWWTPASRVSSQNQPKSVVRSQKSAGTFIGTSKNGDFAEALAEAIATAKNQIPTDHVTWKLIEVSGQDGGFVLVRELAVTIEVFLPN